MKPWSSVTFGIALVWAGVIMASAVILKGSEYFSQLLPILATGSAVSLIILGGVKAKMENKGGS